MWSGPLCAGLAICGGMVDIGCAQAFLEKASTREGDGRRSVREQRTRLSVGSVHAEAGNVSRLRVHLDLGDPPRCIGASSDPSKQRSRG